MLKQKRRRNKRFSPNIRDTRDSLERVSRFSVIHDIAFMLW